MTETTNSDVIAAQKAVLSRRAALRKMGLSAGASVIAAFTVDDLARNVIRRLREQDAENAVLASLDKEFSTSGVAFADETACSQCGRQYCVSSNKCTEEYAYEIRCGIGTAATQDANFLACNNNADAAWNSCKTAHCPAGQLKPQCTTVTTKPRPCP